jgi:hypothetical protein
MHIFFRPELIEILFFVFIEILSFYRFYRFYRDRLPFIEIVYRFYRDFEFLTVTFTGKSNFKSKYFSLGYNQKVFDLYPNFIFNIQIFWGFNAARDNIFFLI